MNDNKSIRLINKSAKKSYINKNFDQHIFKYTKKPSNIIIYILFITIHVLYYVLSVVSWFIPTHRSNEANAFRIILKSAKYIRRFQNYKTLDYIRFPVMSTISPHFLSNHTIMKCDNFYACWSFPSKYVKKTGYVILYVHGGGFISGDISCCIGVCDYIAKEFDCPVFIPQYRIHPENKMDESVNDLITSIDEIRKTYGNECNIYAIGDSAGGGLICLTIQKLINQKIQNTTSKYIDIDIPIKKCVLWSPGYVEFKIGYCIVHNK